MINLQKWYCPNCGIVESKGDYRDDMFICRGCDRQQFKRTPPLFVTAMTARIANLQSLIADAPHEEWCNVVLTGPRQDCDCWKSSALDTKEKSNVHD